MQTKVFTCPDCGCPIYADANIWLPGVTGDITTSDGKIIHFDDPIIDHYCTKCKQERLNKFLEDMKHEKDS